MVYDVSVSKCIDQSTTMTSRGVYARSPKQKYSLQKPLHSSQMILFDDAPRFLVFGLLVYIFVYCSTTLGSSAFFSSWQPDHLQIVQYHEVSSSGNDLWK